MKPSTVIAPRVLGRELAAMLVRGEEMTPKLRVKRIVQRVKTGS